MVKRGSRAVVALVLFAGCAVAVQERMFIRPGPARNATPAQLESVERHSIVTADGATLGAIQLERDDAAVDVLYFGGNEFRIDDFGGLLADAFKPLPVSVFVADHRGYGRSTGKPTLALLKSDALALYDYLDARNGTRPIIVHGFSLGSFLAAHVAANRPVAGTILESTATNVKDWARANVPSPLIRVKIADSLKGEDNVRFVKSYTAPLLLMTGANDRITPPSFAQTLYAKSATAESMRRIAIVEGKGHGDVMASENAIAAYRELIRLVGTPGD